MGLTENEAKARGIKYGKGYFPGAASGRSLSLGRDEGITKALFDENTHRIIRLGDRRAQRRRPHCRGSACDQDGCGRRGHRIDNSSPSDVFDQETLVEIRMVGSFGIFVKIRMI